MNGVMYGGMRDLKDIGKYIIVSRNENYICNWERGYW